MIILLNQPKHYEHVVLAPVFLNSVSQISPNIKNPVLLDHAIYNAQYLVRVMF